MSKKYKFRRQFTGEDGRIHDVVSNVSEEDLFDKIKKIKKDIELGRTRTKSNKTTVQEWADECFATYKANIKDDTVKNEKACFDKWVGSEIGNKRLKDVKNIDCQHVMNRTSGYLARYTIRRVFQLMKFVFDRAVDNDLIEESPVKGKSITLPEGAKSSRRALTKYEEDIFLRTVEKHPEYVFFLVMLKCGLRNSEVAGLQGKDITMREDVTVLHINGTKTDAAVRDVPCPDYLAERLPKVGPFEYIFKNQVGGKMNKPNYERLWRYCKRDMNIEAGCEVYQGEPLPPYRIDADLVAYDLRHSYCTFLMKSGIDIRVAQKLMGHSDVRMTANIYSHPDNESLVDVGRILNGDAGNTEEDHKVTL